MDMVVLKEMIWAIFSSGGYGGFERTSFGQFLLLENLVVLERLDLENFYLERVWCYRKVLLLPVFILQGCGSLERTDFWTSVNYRQCGGLENTSFVYYHLGWCC